MKFLATPAAANAWAADGGFASGNHNVNLAVFPTAIDKANQVAMGKAKSVVFDMSDEQPASFGATTGQGEWGILPDLPGRTPPTSTGSHSSSRPPRPRLTRRASSALSTGGITVEPSLAAAPPDPDDGRNWGRYVAGSVSRARALRARRLGRLPRRLHGPPQLLRAERLPGNVGRARQLQAPVARPRRSGRQSRTTRSGSRSCRPWPSPRSACCSR